MDGVDLNGELVGVHDDQFFSHVEHVEVDEEGNVTDVISGVYYGDRVPVSYGGSQEWPVNGSEHPETIQSVSEVLVDDIGQHESGGESGGVPPAIVDEPIVDDGAKSDINDDIVVVEAIGEEGDLVLRILEKVDDGSNEGGVHSPAPAPVEALVEGMLFNSGVEFVAHAHRYGHSAGFGITIRDSVKDTRKKGPKEDKDAKMSKWFNMENKYRHYRKIRLRCRKGGVHISRSCDPNRSSTSCKTDCPYVVNACRTPINGTVWKVTKVHDFHNHDLTPELCRHLPFYRRISLEDQRVATELHKGGVGVANMYDIFVNKHKGYENVPFTESDLRNFIYFMYRKPVKDTDFARMEVHFQKLREQSPGFFYEYEVDGETLKNVFWADSRCREAFNEFGDVVSFDTTFVSNRYRMPFAPFVGVNNHGKTMLFGCALIGREDIASFSWLFKTWKKCMGKQPACILTDQDKAIGRAIAMEFPGISHRWCIWHVMKNCRKHLGMLPQWGELSIKLQDILHDSFSIEEFEGEWESWVEYYGLGANGWVKDMYRDRGRWVPVYFKSNFWAGMSSTQRSEGMNHYLKGFVDLNTCLAEFVEEYAKAVGKRIEEETKDNAVGRDRSSMNRMKHRFEPIFEKLFTRDMFVKFHDEVNEMCRNTASISNVISETVVEYLVVVKMFREGWTKLKNFRVTMDRSSLEVKCECKMFEFSGIMCTHMLRVFWEEDTLEVPQKYVCRRWRKDIPRKYLIEKYPMSAIAAPVPIESTRYEEIHKVAEEICFMVMNRDELHKETLMKLTLLMNEVKISTANPEGISSHDVGGVGTVYRNIAKARETGFVGERGECSVKDPCDKRGRGRGQIKRKKSIHEEIGAGRGGKRGAGRGRGKGCTPSTPSKDVENTSYRGWGPGAQRSLFNPSISVTGGSEKITLSRKSFGWF